MTVIICYVFAGGIYGYVSARLQATLETQSERQPRSTLEHLLFPGAVYAIYMLTNITLFWSRGSTLMVPFEATMSLLFLLLAIHYPLARLGTTLGHRMGPIKFMASMSGNYPAPTTTNPLPAQPWFVSLPFTIFASGLFFWFCCLNALTLVLDTIWKGAYYYPLWSLFWMLIMVFMLCSQTTVLFLYWQLKQKNYDWWWRAFANGGSLAIHAFFFCILYYFASVHDSQKTPLSTTCLYVGFMALLCTLLFCMLGFVGVMASIAFHGLVFPVLCPKLGYERLADDQEAGEAIHVKATEQEEALE